MGIGISEIRTFDYRAASESLSLSCDSHVTHVTPSQIPISLFLYQPTAALAASPLPLIPQFQVWSCALQLPHPPISPPTHSFMETRKILCQSI